MSPCIDNWLDLGSLEQMKTYGNMIEKLTDPANFEAYRYMPVTRDITSGQRTLLNNFLDGVTMEKSRMTLRDESDTTTGTSDYGALSKSMRTPVISKKNKRL
jgi:hypothetical protein